MDVRHDFAVESHPAPPQPPIEPAELRAVLIHLNHEMCRPLESLRAKFDRMLNDRDRPISADQRGQLQTMLGQCDELLTLTRGSLDCARLAPAAPAPVAHRSRPRRTAR